MDDATRRRMREILEGLTPAGAGTGIGDVDEEELYDLIRGHLRSSSVREQWADMAKNHDILLKGLARQLFEKTQQQQ